MRRNDTENVYCNYYDSKRFLCQYDNLLDIPITFFLLCRVVTDGTSAATHISRILANQTIIGLQYPH